MKSKPADAKPYALRSRYRPCENRWRKPLRTRDTRAASAAIPFEIYGVGPVLAQEKQNSRFGVASFCVALQTAAAIEACQLKSSTGLTIFVLAAWTFVVYRLASSEREARLMRDVERGLIECAVRYPNSIPESLSDRWERGLAEVRNGKIACHPLRSEMSSAGQTREFSQLSSYRLLGAPSKKPAELADQSTPDPGRH